MYRADSMKAEEFISHEEIMETLAYAEENKNNRELVEQVLAKARERKGLNHKEASLLLACEDEEKNQEIYALAEQIKKDFHELYLAMNGKTLREMDEIIYPVCKLCRDHERSGFVEGIKVGIRLRQELTDERSDTV